MIAIKLSTAARLFRLLIVPASVVVLGGPRAVRAADADNPILRKLIERKIREELNQHDSEDKAWYDEKSKDRVKYFQMNFFGREINRRVASWTEQSKTWVWLEDPEEKLALEVTHFAIRDGRVEFALSARAKAGFRVWGRIPRLAKGNASGTVWVKFEIEGSAALGGEGLKDSRITRLKANLSDLQFNNDLGSPFENLVVDALNNHVRKKNGKLCGSVEKAINRVEI